MAPSPLLRYCGGMKSPVTDYLNELLERNRNHDGGERASYIPELARANPHRFGIAMTTVEGRTYSVGDDNIEFTLQSMSKPFAYAAALDMHGKEYMSERVGVEPSGEAFNELSIEEDSNRPDNPMINVGAIAVHGLLLEKDTPSQERIEYLREFFSRLAGRELTIDQDVFTSELETAERNFAMGHMLKGLSVFDGSAHGVVEGYIAQCAVKVDIRDLSVMGATLSNGGIQPHTGEQVIEPLVARQVLSVMVSAGMYDASGTWFADVGIPAKSGVSGGILGVLPGQLGLGVFSPSLDAKGNSVRGIRVFKELSERMGLHMMDTEAYSYHAVRAVRQVGDELIIELQGRLEFSNAEEILSQLEELEYNCTDVVIDLTRVSEANRVGRHMLLDGLQRLQEEDLQVSLLDPDNILKFKNSAQDDGIHYLRSRQK